MTESIYKEYQNKYYNPTDNDKKPGDNDNWKSIQKGFHDIGSTQLETSKGLTLGKGTEDEVRLSAAELEEMKSANGVVFKSFESVYNNVSFTATYSSATTPKIEPFGLEPNTNYAIWHEIYITGASAPIVYCVSFCDHPRAKRSDSTGTIPLNAINLQIHNLLGSGSGGTCTLTYRVFVRKVDSDV